MKKEEEGRREKEEGRRRKKEERTMEKKKTTKEEEGKRSEEGRNLLRLAEQKRTEIIEISSHHNGGEMLAGLGNIAVILRYRLA